MPLKLIVRDLGASEEPRVSLYDQPIITIGRGEQTHVQLHDRRMVVSKLHAELRAGTPPQLVDLGSKNYTYLNGHRLLPQEPVDVRTGDVIRIGDFEIDVIVIPAAVTEPEPDTADWRSVLGGAPDASERVWSASEETLRRAVRELIMLNDLAREIGASVETPAILDTIVQHALRAVHAQQGLITLVDVEEEDSMKTLVRRLEIPGPLYSVNEGVFAWMRYNKKPLLINNPLEETRFDGIPWDQNVESLLCVPLLSRGELIGLLSVCNKEDGADFTDEDVRLVSIIAGQSAQVIENARLIEEQRKLLRMEQEFRMAYEIQMNLLPTAAPEVEGYDLAAASIPAQTVGGDYFDFVPVDDHSMALVVGDVSGKGLPAALLMANVQATIRAQALWSASAREALERANTLLCRSVGKGSFVTLFYSVLDYQRHRLCYANAGHNRPILLRAGRDPEILETAGLVLGFRAGWTYDEQNVDLAPGDVLLIYSDGITEAINPAHEQFGEERLTSLLRVHRQAAARDLVTVLYQAVRQHAAGTPQVDDMTVMVVKRAG